VSGWSVVGTAPLDAESFSDTGLSELTTFYYRIRANSLNGYSPYSEVVSAITPEQPLSTPNIIGAVAISNTQIEVSWEDIGQDQLGYAIERSPNGVDGWAQVGTVSHDETSYNDADLQPATTYWYRVRAFRD
jgi:hypothetical protein